MYRCAATTRFTSQPVLCPCTGLKALPHHDSNTHLVANDAQGSPTTFGSTDDEVGCAQPHIPQGHHTL